MLENCHCDHAFLLDYCNPTILKVFLQKIKIKISMNIILKKGVSITEIDRQIKANSPKPQKHNFEKYVGLLKLKKDPLIIQKEMRNEWK